MKILARYKCIGCPGSGKGVDMLSVVEGPKKGEETIDVRPEKILPPKQRTCKRCKMKVVFIKVESVVP